MSSLATFTPLFIHLVVSFIALNMSLIGQPRALRNIAPLIIIFSGALCLGWRDPFAGFDTSKYLSAFDILATRPTFSFVEINLAYIGRTGSYVEPLFAITSATIAAITGSHFAYLTLIALMPLTILWLSYRKVTREHVLALFLFSVSLTFVFTFGNAIRQAIACSIVLFAITDFVINRANKRFALFVFLAAGFHFSAILFLALPWLMRLSIARLLTIQAIVLLSVLLLPIESLIQSLQIPFLNSKISAYTSGNKASVFSLNTFGYIAICWVSILFLPKSQSKDYARHRELLRAYIAIFTIQTVFVFSSIGYDRIAAYRFMFEPIIIATIVERVSFSQRWVTYYSLISVSILYGAIWVQQNVNVITTLTK